MSFGSGPAKISQDSGHEEGDALYGDVDAEEAESAEVVGDVKERTLNVVRSDLLSLIGSALQFQTLGSDHALALGQEPALFGASGHQEWCAETDDGCKEALKEEDVAPSVNAHRGNAPWRDARKAAEGLVLSITSSHANLPSSKETAESTSHRRSRDVNTNAEEQLIALVETGDEEGQTAVLLLVNHHYYYTRHSRHDTTLKNTEHSSGSQESFETLDKGSAQRHKTKADYEDW